MKSAGRKSEFQGHVHVLALDPFSEARGRTPRGLAAEARRTYQELATAILHPLSVSPCLRDSNMCFSLKKRSSVYSPSSCYSPKDHSTFEDLQSVPGESGAPLTYYTTSSM